MVEPGSYARRESDIAVLLFRLGLSAVRTEAEKNGILLLDGGRKSPPLPTIRMFMKQNSNFSISRNGGIAVKLTDGNIMLPSLTAILLV